MRLRIVLPLFILLIFSTAKSNEPATIELDNELSVYEPGSRISGKIRLPANRPAGAILLRLRDFEGTDVLSDPVRPEAPENTFSLPPTDGLGYYLIECHAEGQSQAMLASKGIAVIPPFDDSGLENPFGGMVFPHISYPYPDREKDAKLMRRIGMRWVRTGRLKWLIVQKSADAKLNWDEADRDMTIWADHGLKVITTLLMPMPVWASQAVDDPATDTRSKGLIIPKPEYLPLLENYCRLLAERYKGNIVFCEVGNEVDATIFWKGSLENSLNHDRLGIMKDYADMFKLVRNALKQGDPQIYVCPNTTGSMPDGAHYQPWLATMSDLGVCAEMDAFSTHYDADLDAVRSEWSKRKQKDVPIIITEIGGIVRGKTNEFSPFGPEAAAIIRSDWEQCVHQYSRGVTAMCKFMFREQNTYGGEGHMMAGLIGYDFSIRPQYVAFGTLIRNLAGATFVRELNLVQDASSGWVKAYRFERGGEGLNILFLKDMDEGTITLRSAKDKLRIIDVMGNSSELTVQNGSSVLRIEKGLPVIVMGDLQDAPQEPKYPGYRKIAEIPIPLNNASLDTAPDSPNAIPSWGLLYNEENLGSGKTAPSGFSAAVDGENHVTGPYSLRMSADRKTNWYGVIQSFDGSILPRPGKGQYLVFVINYDMKCKDVRGIGGGYSISFRNDSNERIHFTDAGKNWIGGTFDWKAFEGKNKVESFPEETTKLTIEFYLGNATGTVWFDNIRATIEIWDKEPVK